MRFNSVFQIVLALSAVLLRTGSAQTTPQPEELIQAGNTAVEFVDLKALRPYMLQATIIAEPSGKKGRLTIYQDKDRPRTELEFGTYHELKIVLGDRQYVKRSAADRPAELSTMEDSSQLGRIIKASSDTLRPAYVLQIEGTQANCSEGLRPPFDIFIATVEVGTTDISMVEVGTTSGSTRGSPTGWRRIGVNAGLPPLHGRTRYCFDPYKKVLLLASTFDGVGDKPVWEVRYTGYQPVGSLQFPGAIRNFILGKPSGVDFEDIQVSSLKPDAAQFTPPSDSAESETCEGVQEPQLTQKVEPSYPRTAKIAHIRGDVSILATIKKDGALDNITLISGHPTLAAEALDAVRQWRFSPPKCGSGPTAMQAEFIIRFHP